MLKNILQLFKKRKETEYIPSKTILIIDDGEVERKFLSRSLEKGGYKAITAEDGEAGLKLAKDMKPDLILLDFIMPGLRGDEVCQRLKLDEQTRNIPVIFLTGSVRPQSIFDSYESGAEYYLAKPISTQELLKQVGMIFQEKQSSLAS